MKKAGNLIFTCVFGWILGGCAGGSNLNSSNLNPEVCPVITDAPQALELNVTQDAKALPAVFRGYVAPDKYKYLERVFAPWVKGFEGAKASDFDGVFERVKYDPERIFYAENRLPRPPSWYDEQRANANFAAFGSVSRPALITHATPLRLLATEHKIFLAPKKDGEGYPFGYLQETTLAPFTPVFVSHYSADGAWAFVRESEIHGFVRRQFLRELTDDEARAWRTRKFAAMTRDDASALGFDGSFKFEARMGGILPYTEQNATHYIFKREWYLPKTAASEFLPLSDSNLKEIINRFMGQVYGWGGENELRDCSLFLKDLFAIFAIWLPRNSAAQAKIGEKVSLKGMQIDEKLRVIKSRATPFLTLLAMSGHIMLYAGDENAVHAAWGVRTKDGGRAIIGRVATTDLRIGKGEPNIAEDSLFISRISGLATPADVKKSAFEQGYGVRVENNEIIFADGTKMPYASADNSNLKLADDGAMINASVADTLEPYDFDAPIGEPKGDAGRSRNDEFLGKIYGKSEREIEGNLTEVVWLKDFGAQKIKFNARNGAAAALSKVSAELNELVKRDRRFLPFLQLLGGTHKYRVIAGTNRLSAHSYGIAIDINVERSHYWRWHKTYANLIPREIVEIFERHGFIWGGRWEHFDTMHFEYRPEFMYAFKVF